MSRTAKLTDKMRRNPAGDWRIEDVEAVCHAHGLNCEPPRRGSHYTVSHPSVPAHLTIPARRPVKGVYIRLLLSYLDAVRAADA